MGRTFKDKGSRVEATLSGDIYTFKSGYSVHTTPAYVVKSGFFNRRTGQLKLIILKAKNYDEIVVEDGYTLARGNSLDFSGFGKNFYLYYRFADSEWDKNKDTSFKVLKYKDITGKNGKAMGEDSRTSHQKYVFECTIPVENHDGKYFQLGERCEMEETCEDVRDKAYDRALRLVKDADLDGVKNNHNVRILWAGLIQCTPKITYIRWYNQIIEPNAAYVLFQTSVPITSARCTNVGNGCSFYSKNDSKKEYVIKITGLAPVKAYTPSIVCSKGSGKESPAASTTVYTKGIAPSVSPGDLELHIDHIISKATAQNSKIVANTISGAAGGTFGTVQPGKIEVNKMKPNSDFTIKLTFESTLVHNPPPRDVNGNIVNIAPERKDITVTGKTKEVAVITSASNFEFYDDTLFNVVYDDDKEFTVELLHRDYHDGINKCIWLHRFPDQKTASLKHVWTQNEKDEFYKQWPTNTDRENITLRITTLGKYKTESNKAWYTKEIGAVCILTGKNYTGHINIQEGNNFRRCRCWVNVTGRNDGWKSCVLWINTSNGFRRTT